MSYYTAMIRKFAKDWMDFFLQESLRHTDLYCIGYQEKCRIYLDEYDGQEELRKELLDSPLLYKNRFGQDSVVLDGLIEDIYIINTSSFEIIEKIADYYCYFESDQIFNNRWMVKK
jgi:hypothetical protein